MNILGNLLAKVIRDSTRKWQVADESYKNNEEYKAHSTHTPRMYNAWKHTVPIRGHSPLTKIPITQKLKDKQEKINESSYLFNL